MHIKRQINTAGKRVVFLNDCNFCVQITFISIKIRCFRFKAIEFVFRKNIARFEFKFVFEFGCIERFYPCNIKPVHAWQFLHFNR